MMNFLTVLFLCIPLTVMCQNHESMDRTYFENEQIKTEGYLISGKKQGKWIHYFETGTIRTIQNFNNGKQEGRSFWYHPNGSIGWEENYENGIAHGTFRYYDETGQLRIEKTYEKGKEVSYLFDGKDLKNN